MKYPYYPNAIRIELDNGLVFVVAATGKRYRRLYDATRAIQQQLAVEQAFRLVGASRMERRLMALGFQLRLGWN